MLTLRRMPEEYHAKGKSCMCFVDLEKAFDIVQRKVLEWAMRRKIIRVLVRSVINLYEGAKTRVRVHSDLSEVKVECTKDLCCHLFFCTGGRCCH